MKKINFIFSLICGFVFLTSCSPTHYYQIHELHSDLLKHGNGEYYYSNDVCEISYDFWDENGRASFMVKNLTDKILYINKAKSFFIKNGEAYNYFLNRTIISNRTSSSIKSGAFSFLVGGLYNIPITYSQSSKDQISSGMEITEESILAIPPHSFKIISEYPILNSYYFDCDFNMTPSKKERPTLEFSENGSPIKFQNYICYYTEDCPTEKIITNDFYVSKITNVNKNKALKKEKQGCDGYQTIVYIFNDYSPSSFFIKYTNPAKNKASKKTPKVGISGAYDIY